MVQTRSEAELALQHVLTNVMCKTPTDRLVRALAHEGIKELHDFLNMNVVTIDSLQCPDDKDPSIMINIYRQEKALMMAFKAYVVWRSEPLGDNNPITDKDWVTLDSAHFNNFRISPHYIAITAGTPLPTTTTPPKLHSN